MSDIEGAVINAFAKGEVNGLAEITRPENLKTQISQLFFYPKYVYKYYLHSNDFFNTNFRNLASFDSREYFYKRDFFWNNYFNKDVYLELIGLRIERDTVSITDQGTKPNDYVIKMKKIDISKNLSQLLNDKSITNDDAYQIGYQMTKMIAEFPEKIKSDENLYLVKKRWLEDLKNWMYSADPNITREQTEEVIVKLNNYIDNNQAELEKFPTDAYTIAIDNHSDNIYYSGNVLSFIDIYPPKEAWIFSPPIRNVYRPATDVLILGGPELFEAMLVGYKDYYGTIDRTHETFYFIYSACIQCVSLFNLSDNSEIKKANATKYWEFIQDELKKLPW